MQSFDVGWVLDEPNDDLVQRANVSEWDWTVLEMLNESIVCSN
jgi:hypothetical protein